jgi:hypothetical protein
MGLIVSPGRPTARGHHKAFPGEEQQDVQAAQITYRIMDSSRGWNRTIEDITVKRVYNVGHGKLR